MGSWRSIKGTLLCECAHTPIPRHSHTESWRETEKALFHTHTHTRAHSLYCTHLLLKRSQARIHWQSADENERDKRVLLSSTLNSEPITMGAVWTALLLCLFLLLLNTRQSAAVPHNTGKRVFTLLRAMLYTRNFNSHVFATCLPPFVLIPCFYFSVKTKQIF